MPTLRELQKRLKSAETIKQLAGAMRTAATAKYMKASSRLAAYSAYAEALAAVRGEEKVSVQDSVDSEKVFLLLSGNHGLCGGYHQELFGFFLGRLKGVGPFRVITVGKRARDFCRDKSLPVLKDIPVSDIPSFAEAKELADLVSSLGVSRIEVVYQRFENMLKQFPTEESLVLPSACANKEGEDGEVLFVPDGETVTAELGSLMLSANVYRLLLSAAAGVQGATVIAMRSAFDNACGSIRALETRINRLRQAAVTAGVLETSSEIYE